MYIKHDIPKYIDYKTIGVIFIVYLKTQNYKLNINILMTFKKLFKYKIIYKNYLKIFLKIRNFSIYFMNLFFRYC